MTLLECVVCGTEFRNYTRTPFKTCSDRCSTENAWRKRRAKEDRRTKRRAEERRLARPPRNCRICNISIDHLPLMRKLCSDHCRDVAIRNTKIKLGKVKRSPHPCNDCQITIVPPINKYCTECAAVRKTRRVKVKQLQDSTDASKARYRLWYHTSGQRERNTLYKRQRDLDTKAAVAVAIQLGVAPETAAFKKSAQKSDLWKRLCIANPRLDEKHIWELYYDLKSIDRTKEQLTTEQWNRANNRRTIAEKNEELWSIIRAASLPLTDLEIARLFDMVKYHARSLGESTRRRERERQRAAIYKAFKAEGLLPTQHPATYGGTP